MLAPDAPILSICGSANALQFWHLQITKNFKKPEYYIGQLVLHKMKVKQGEILHPVTIIGIRWNGYDWEYAVELPANHPLFKPEDHEWDELSRWQLEPM